MGDQAAPPRGTAVAERSRHRRGGIAGHVESQRAGPAQALAEFRLASPPASSLEDGGDADGRRRAARCARRSLRGGSRRRGGFSECVRGNRNTRDPRLTCRSEPTAEDSMKTTVVDAWRKVAGNPWSEEPD